MTITKAGADQYDAVREFYHSLIDAVGGSDYYIGWEKDVYPAPEFLRASIENGGLYTAVCSDRITAAMVLNHECNEGYSGIRWLTDASPSEVLVIHALGVHPDNMRRGIAKAMVRKAIEIAEKEGTRSIRLDVLEGNLPAEKLYTGLGFCFTGKVKMYYEDTGWTDFGLYEYVIDR